MADIVSSTLGPMQGMANNAVTLVIIILAGIILVGILVGIILSVLHAKRYKEYIVFIFQDDGFGHTIWKSDEGGVFVDRRTGNKRLFLKNSHVGLEPDNIPFIPTSKGNKVVLLLQTGLKNYCYIKPNIDSRVMRFTVGEEDVNWGTNEYEAQKKRFNLDKFAQYFPFIILAVAFIILAILMVSIFQKIPMIKDLALEMKNVAELLVQARTGTTIIS